MTTSLSRRGFLKLGALALGGMALRPINPEREDPNVGLLGRVTIASVSIYKEPSMDGQIVAQRFRDELVPIYAELTPPEGPAYNPLWYRVWGGYAHSAYLQRVEYRFNPVLPRLPESGQLCEITVPYSQSQRYTSAYGWENAYRLYHGSTHWATSIDEGPDGDVWYQITDELWPVDYHVPAAHMRPIPDEELAPISPDLPPGEKRVLIRISDQTLTAYEGDQIALHTTISSGIPSTIPGDNGLPTATPKGRFYISSKLPSKHMGQGRLTDDLDDYVLPGVPWTGFFHPTGVAFHGTYWHNNFGWPMSHGCINMRNEEAKWLFRWTTPVSEPGDWDRRGRGTLIEVV